MPNLQTLVSVPKISQPICYADRICSLGSCFSEHIGRYLRSLGYHVESNPFGSLYNPLSISAAMDRLETGIAFEVDELFKHNELYHSPMHHGTYSGIDAVEVLNRINMTFERGVRAYHLSNVLCLTWGTARAYRDQHGRIVANCHKLPADRFERIDYTPEQMLRIVKPDIARYLDADSSRIIVQTISPIRHLGDGAHRNALSKATLLLFAEELMTLYPQRIFYFPAYEIVLDELRDYRFYADDMTHPSHLTTQIICSRFEQTMLLPAEQAVRKQVQAFRCFESHRPLRQDSAHRHQQAIADMRTALLSRYPDISL